VSAPDPFAEVHAPLAAWLAGQLSAAVEISDLERPAVGQSNDTVLFTATWTHASQPHRERLVLRRQATANQIFREPDVIREARVLQGLAAASRVPVPEVRWCETDPAVLGAPFFVMAEVPGRVPAGRPSIHTVGWLPTLTTRERERLWTSAMETLVAVHEVDWQRSHGFLLGDDGHGATLDAHVDRLADWYAWSTAGRGFAVTDAALAFLVEHRSEVRAAPPALVWGDARVGNMIFGDEHTVVAAIDWEVASIGPPAIDVAHWLFFDDFATDACDIAPLPGWPDRATTVARYETLAGRALDDLEFYELMEEFFMATTLIRQADARVARGLAPPDTRMGHDNTVTQMLARRLRLPVPDLSPDYIAHRGGTVR
jgi:aminoglycoside phosphotransferase (APT) family kinase protein